MTDTAPESGTEIERAPDMSRGVMRDVSIDARIRYARELAHAGLLPRDFRDRPANVLYAVEYGNMLGIHPLAAITGVHVMDGKPTASSSLMGALVRRAGHRLRVRTDGTVAGGDFRATAEITRVDDPEFTYAATWDLHRALRAGLIDRLDVDEQGRTIVRARTQGGKPGSWEKFPEAMAKARAISEVSREACEEALCGVHYTAEELGAVVNEEGDVLQGEVVSVVETPQAEPAPPTAPVSVTDPDLVRAAIIHATSRTRLAYNLNDLRLGEITEAGKFMPYGKPLREIEVSDADGNVMSAWDLMAKIGGALPAEDPDPDQPAPEPAAEWPANPPGVHPQGGGDQPERLACHVTGCPASAAHDTGGHGVILKAGGNLVTSIVQADGSVVTPSDTEHAVACERCLGSGMDPEGTIDPCGRCDGNGYFLPDAEDPPAGSPDPDPDPRELARLNARKATAEGAAVKEGNR